MARQTTLCYIERGGEYLMLHRIRKRNDENHDKWIGVGGKLEPGETPEACVLREAREETGLTLLRPRYRGIVDFAMIDPPWREIMHLFTASEFTGELIECDEGALEWIDRRELANLEMWEGDAIFLNLIADERTPFFRLKLEYDGERLVYAELDGKPIKDER